MSKKKHPQSELELESLVTSGTKKAATTLAVAGLVSGAGLMGPPPADASAVGERIQKLRASISETTVQTHHTILDSVISQNQLRNVADQQHTDGHTDGHSDTHTDGHTDTFDPIG